jgi:hypothetical protein
MSAKLAFEMMKDYPPSIAATKKVSNGLPAGFVWYAFEWLGDNPKDWEIMKVTGSETRISKSGKNKGEPIIVRGATKKTVYLTRAEITAAAPEKGNTP